jgi:ribosomal protein L40E
MSLLANEPEAFEPESAPELLVYAKPAEGFECRVCGTEVLRSSLVTTRWFRQAPVSDRRWNRMMNTRICETCDADSLAW